MIIDRNDKLSFFQNLYEDADNKYKKILEELDKWERQVNGDKTIDGGKKDASYCRNITYELIESQVNGYIPSVKVLPQVANKVNIARAKLLERYLNNIKDKIDFESLNDLDERLTYIYGGSVWLIEWDNTIVTHNSIGNVTVRLLHPKMIRPQPAVYDIKEMEYFFILSDDTHENVERKYGVSFEEVKKIDNENASDSDDTCTVICCFYRDNEGRVCKYVWADNVELEDEEDYWGRKIRKCKKCGKIESLCKCKNPEFEKTELEYEEITKTMNFFPDESGEPQLIIAPESRVLKDGLPVMEERKAPLMYDGVPAMEEINGLLMPMSTEIEVPKTQKTKIPFYRPSLFPVVIRKNISKYNSLFGQSDCEVIRDQQQTVNKLESRINEKSFKSGVIPYHGANTQWRNTDELYDKGLTLSDVNEKNLLGVLDTRVDITPDQLRSEKVYNDAKTTLGISSSYQGMPDTTAKSGIAKQLQIMQSGGRLESKRIMKNVVYSAIYEIIFQFSLAYADEPRPVSYQNGNGDWEGAEFNKYAFLERDKAGEWYYMDEFLFSIDKASDIGRNREIMWQEARSNFQIGAYGNPADIDALILYWQELDELHYPNAAKIYQKLLEKKKILLQGGIS